MKRIKALFLLPVILLLCSCTVSKESENSATENNTESTTERIEVHKLVIKQAPVVNYYQYEELDLTSLKVAEAVYDAEDELISSTEIDDYDVYYDSGDRASSGDRLTAIGQINLSIRKDGVQSVTLSVFVDEVRQFKQTLSILSLPIKQDYRIGESFEANGLQVQLRTRYTSDKSQLLNEIIDDYTLTIDGKIADTFVFNSIGSYTVQVTYTGWDEKELTSSFSIMCNVEPSSKLKNPSPYIDTTIDEVTDSNSVTITFTGLESADKAYYSPSEVTNLYNVETIRHRDPTNNVTMPTKGEVPILVVPVITPGDEDKATIENHELITKAFFGDSADLHFESLHSYYYQSSYGQLDITGAVTGYFDPRSVSNSFNSISSYTQNSVYDLPQLAATWAKDTYDIDMTKYDSDSDGFIDAIWLVYLHETDGNVFWAFTTNCATGSGNVNDPKANVFGWASFDFLNDFGNTNLDNSACDAHVLIHETGHILGAMDYYSYSYTNDYGPLGKADMMDNNVADHNAYTKLFYGWTTPYIVYGNCSITIPSSLYKDAVIVIPYDNYQFTTYDNKVVFNSFDEYLVLELYSDSNLNSQDYDSYQVENIKGVGVKVYHADNRLFRYIQGTYDYSFELFSNPLDPFTAYPNSLVFKCISNTEAGSNSESIAYGLDSTFDPYDELRLISQDNTYMSTVNPASTSSLFKSGDSFSMNQYSSQFVNGRFDNGKTLSLSFTIA